MPRVTGDEFDQLRADALTNDPTDGRWSTPINAAWRLASTWSCQARQERGACPLEAPGGPGHHGEFAVAVIDGSDLALVALDNNYLDDDPFFSSGRVAWDSAQNLLTVDQLDAIIADLQEARNILGAQIAARALAS